MFESCFSIEHRPRLLGILQLPLYRRPESALSRQVNFSIIENLCSAETALDSKSSEVGSRTIAIALALEVLCVVRCVDSRSVAIYSC